MSESSDDPPFRHIQPYMDALETISQMQSVLDELESDIQSAHWIALGGRGVYSPKDVQQTPRALDGWVEELDERLAELPNPYEHSERWDGRGMSPDSNSDSDVTREDLPDKCSTCEMRYTSALTEKDIRMHEEHCPYQDGRGMDRDR